MTQASRNPNTFYTYFIKILREDWQVNFFKYFESKYYFKFFRTKFADSNDTEKYSDTFNKHHNAEIMETPCSQYSQKYLKNKT